MPNTTHYALEVTCIMSIQHSEERYRLIFKLESGERCTEIGEVKPDKSHRWNGTLAFSSLKELSVLNASVIKVSKLGGSCVAYVSVELSDLLGKCSSGTYPLDLIMTPGKSPAPVGTIHVCLKKIDEAQRTEIDVERAKLDIKRIEKSANAADTVDMAYTSAANAIDMVGSAVDVMDNIVESIDDITGNIHPYLNLAWKVTTALYRIISHQWKKDKKLIELVQIMVEAYRFARDARTLDDRGRKLTEATAKLLRHTVEVCCFVKEYTARNFSERILKLRSNKKMDEYRETFMFLQQQLDASVVIHSASTSERVSVRVDDISAKVRDIFTRLENVSGKLETIDLRQQLQNLKAVLEPIRSDTYGRERCLLNTRTEYIDKVKDWLFSPRTERNILWFNGIAGSGKTTVAASIMDHCDSNSRLAAFLFFVRGKNEHGSIIRTIAYQLAEFMPELALYIIPAAERLRNITGSTIRTQFETLLLEPLVAAMGVVEDPVIIIIDALDECGTTDQRREILELLKVDFAQLPMQFRFFITSRPENDIMRSLSKRSHVFEIKLESTSTESQNDVRTYINVAMCKALGDPIPDVSAWAEKMDILSCAADGLFIWASTAVKMVTNSDDPFGKVDDLVSNIRSLNGLDNLYGTVLEQSGISWQDPRSVERFGNVLGLVLFGREPVSDDDIDNIFGFAQRKSRLTLQKLLSVLSYEHGQPIRLHHASFADYLLSHERSGNQKWFVDAGYQKSAITAGCFNIMEQQLRFNICNLETSYLKNDEIPGLQIGVVKNIPPHLLYACRFWAEHLHDVPYYPDLASKLAAFAYRHLPHWLEVLSLTRHFNRFAGRALMDAVLWTALDASETSSFLWDAYRLVIIFALPVSQSAPQIYLSMLSLLKDESVVSRHYSETHPTVVVRRFGTKPTTSCIKILHGHGEAVESVAFAPDGKRVVSGSKDGTIRIWDVESGEIVVGPFKGHDDWVDVVAFSTDGKLIVSGSRNCNIRVWDAESGEFVMGRIEGHEGACSIAFSSDGRRTVSGSVDGKIRVWSIESGEIVIGPFEGHSNVVWSLAFSPNGEHIVSGSLDGTILIWGTESQKIVSGPFEGYGSVAFSPDGKRITSVSRCHRICIWDVESGEMVVSPSEGHDGIIWSVAFSPDSRRVVSGSEDSTIRVWDAESGEVVAGPFTGHDSSVSSVAFSSDGKRVVSGSRDNSIRVWDVDSGLAGSISDNQMICDRDTQDREVAVGLFEGYCGNITSVAFSHNEKRLVSGSRDGMIRIWDINSGRTVVGPFKVHDSPIGFVAFSPDSKFIISSSADGMRVSNAISREVVAGPFEGQEGPFAFSRDGRSIVCFTRYDIQLYDVERWEVVQHSGLAGKIPTSVLFLQDGEYIIYCTIDHSICAWDIKSGEVTGILLLTLWESIFRGLVISVACSPDGKRVVCGYSNGTVEVLAAGSRESIAGPFKVHNVHEVAFSPCGKRVASCSHDGTVLVLDAESGAVVTGPLKAYRGRTHSVAFSPNGKFIVLYSDDNIFHIWDTEVATAPASTGPGGLISSSNRDAQYRQSMPERYIRPDWTMSVDGWIVGDQGELLTWVPPDLRQTLLPPSFVTVFGPGLALNSRQFVTKLDLTPSMLGKNWTKGYKIASSNLCLSIV